MSQNMQPLPCSLLSGSFCLSEGLHAFAHCDIHQLVVYSYEIYTLGPITCSYFKDGYRDDGVKQFLLVAGEKMRGNNHRSALEVQAVS